MAVYGHRDMRADPREASVTSSVCGAWSTQGSLQEQFVVYDLHTLAVCLTQKVHGCADFGRECGIHGVI